MTALALLLIAATGARAAEPTSVEQIEANYRKMFPSIDLLDCPAGAEEEVVICARRLRESPRLPLPQEPPEGQRMSGQTPAAADIVSGRESCSTVGPNQNCGGGLPVIPAAIMVGRMIGKLLGGDD